MSVLRNETYICFAAADSTLSALSVLPGAITIDCSSSATSGETKLRRVMKFRSFASA